jgi:hypothetical protein
MKTAEIARAILHRRNNSSPIIMQGDLAKQLGPDGLAEALKRGWVRPSFDTGMLQVTERHDILKTMRSLSEATTHQVGQVITVMDEQGQPQSGKVTGVNPDGTVIFKLDAANTVPAGGRPGQPPARPARSSTTGAAAPPVTVPLPSNGPKGPGIG